MNLQALKALIDGEPENAARTDAEVAAWCNQDSGKPLIGFRNLTAPLMGSVIGAFRAAQVLDEVAALGSAQARWVSWVEGPTPVNVGDAETRASLDTLAALPVETVSLTAEEAAKIKALAERSQTRAEAAGVGRVLPGHVKKARA